LGRRKKNLDNNFVHSPAPNGTGTKKVRSSSTAMTPVSDLNVNEEEGEEI